MSGDVVSIFNLGKVERVGELELASWDLHYVSFWDCYVLLARVVKNTKGYIVDDIGKGRYIVGSSGYFDLSLHFLQSIGDLRSASKAKRRLEVRLCSILFFLYAKSIEIDRLTEGKGEC